MTKILHTHTQNKKNYLHLVLQLLFDFLAIKNDVSFWRKKSSLVGLSKWTVIWRSFSQTVIFLNLCNEGTSLLILIPTGISTIIEVYR